jgi:hypothetical protein
MEAKNFYDLKNRKKFSSSTYKFVTKSGRRFAVTKGPSGNDCWLIVGKAK